jgi:excisionase family DNA binding protein
VLTVPQAAERLGLHPTRVRRLITSGDLSAQKLGRDWLIDVESLERLRAADRPRGRPLAPAHAWAILWLASGEPQLQAMAADWLEPWTISRLRRAMDRGTWRLRLPLLRRRAQLATFSIQPADALRLLADRRLVATGASAAHVHGFGAMTTEVVEAYVAAGDGEPVRKLHRLTSDGRPNVRLHVIDGDWPFPPGSRHAPRIAVAADLAEGNDPRRREAGLTYLAERLGTDALA